MSGIEQSQAIEKCEYSKEQCDSKLDQLEQKIDVDFPFEKNDNGSYSIIKNNIKLDIEISGDKLIQANEIILKMLTFFKQHSNKNSHFYTDWFDGSIDMEKNNFNTEYLSGDKFQELFGLEENKTKLINYLHLILGVTEIEGTYKYNKNDAATEYDELINNTQKKIIIDSIKKIESTKKSTYSGKNIKEILAINHNPTREESFANLLYLMNNTFDIKGLNINTSRSFMELTYNNMIYVGGKDESLHWRGNVDFEYNGGAFIDIKQGNKLLAQFRINDYNDQIILNQLLGNTTSDDYKIPRTSSSKYEGSRDIKK